MKLLGLILLCAAGVIAYLLIAYGVFILAIERIFKNNLAADTIGVLFFIWFLTNLTLVGLLLLIFG
jgi:hypothetical protein